MDVLRKAESIDNYISLCAKSPLNSHARANCSYTLWPSQEIATKYSNMGGNAKIVVLHPSAEGGMPHTRPGNVICIPAYYPDHAMDETLRHEAAHISQRSNPSEWKTKLNREGWFQVADSKIPAPIKERCRLNPDTCWSRFWAFDGRYVPLPIFVREDKPSLREIAIRWYDMSEEITRSVIPSIFTETYGQRSSSEMEHPFELWAYSTSYND